jgi:hypothetical protein
VDLLNAFEERLNEIEAYLALLDGIEKEARGGAPRIGALAVTAQQQRILCSSVYLQLYNLVEATVTWCVGAVSEAVLGDGDRQAADLVKEVRTEWIRTTARTHVELTAQHRLDTVVGLLEGVIHASPISEWEVERGGGGNWDDREIERITRRLGCDFQVTSAVLEGVRRSVRDDKGPLSLVKHLRNELAHGNISFDQCGANVTVAELNDIKVPTVSYLRELVNAFVDYISNHRFLAPERRPGAGVA